MSPIKRWSAHAYPGPITPTFFECKDGQYVALADYEALMLLMTEARSWMRHTFYKCSDKDCELCNLPDRIDHALAALEEKP